MLGKWLERNADLVGISGLVALFGLLIAYWWCPPERDNILNSALIAGGGVTLLIAFWRSAIAQRNSLQERYRIGAELLGSRESGHLSRVLGAAVLDQLMRDDPDGFEESVMRAFQAHLTHPSFFGGNVGSHNAGDTDYGSQDNVFIADATNRWLSDSRSTYQVTLPDWSPFRVNSSGKVEPDSHHEHFARWQSATDRSATAEYE